MRFTDTSKWFKGALLLVASVLLVIDILVYAVVLIPGKIDYSLYEHFVFSIWFIGKIGIVVFLALGRGPIQLSVYAACLPLLAAGFYCGVYNLIIGSYPIQMEVLLYWLLIIAPAAIIALSHKYIKTQ